MPGELTPFPKPHSALPTSMTEYEVDMAVSNQLIQIHATAVWTVRLLPHKSIMMPLNRQPTDVAPI
jgi:hypothetical protein